jgi:hypothetical protein
LDEVQVTAAPIGACVPLLNCATAKNCSVIPAWRTAEAGASRMAVRVAAVLMVVVTLLDEATASLCAATPTRCPLASSISTKTS